MDNGLLALRVIDLTATMTALIVLSVVMVQSKRRLVYVGAFTYFLHSLIYQSALLYASITGGNLEFINYWAIGLRVHVTIMVTSYGVYFARLYALRRC